MHRLFSHPRVRRHASQLWKFALTGGIGSTIDLGTVALLVHFNVLPEQVAFVVSSCFAIVFVFLSNKYFTFRNREKAGGQLLRFAIVYGGAIVLNILLSNAFYSLGVTLFAAMFPNTFIAVAAKAGAIGIGAVLNYTLSHAFIFKRGEQVETVVG